MPKTHQDYCDLNSIKGACTVREPNGNLCRLNVNGNCNRAPTAKNRLGKGNIGLSKAWERKLEEMKKEEEA